jgi:hypothetical protein
MADMARSITKALRGKPSPPTARRLARLVCEHAADGLPHLDLVADLERAGLPRLEAAAIVACHGAAPPKSVRDLCVLVCALACAPDRAAVQGAHVHMLAAVDLIRAAGEDPTGLHLAVEECLAMERSIQSDEHAALYGVEAPA